jgi:hypothetical protein
MGRLRRRRSDQRQLWSRSALYGIMYGVRRTTIYLPDELKTAVEQEAVREGVTEAEVIRRALTEHLTDLGAPPPELPLFPDGFGVDITGAGASNDL